MKPRKYSAIILRSGHVRQPGEIEFDIREVVGLIRRRARLIALSTMATLALAAWFIATTPPIYTASTLVLVDTQEASLLDAGAATRQTPIDNARLDSEVEILRSSPILLAVIDAHNLVEDPEFGGAPKPGRFGWLSNPFSGPDDMSGEDLRQLTLGRLASAVWVQRRAMTYLVTVSVSARDPARAATLANAISQTFIDRRLHARIATIKDSGQIVANQIAEARTRLTETAEQFEALIADAAENAPSSAGLSALRRQQSAIDTRLDVIGGLAQATASSLADKDWNGLAGLLDWNGNEPLLSEQAWLRNQTDTMASAPVSLRDRLIVLDSALEQRGRSALETLRAEEAALRTERRDVNRHIREGLLAEHLPDEMIETLYALRRSSEQTNAQYQALLARQSQLQVEANLQLPNLHIVAPALPPLSPSHPNAALLLAMSALAGLTLGLGLALIKENYIGGFASEEHVRSVLRVPVPGEIPHQKTGRTAGWRATADAMVHLPMSPFANAVRQVRLGIDAALSGTEADVPAGKAILVSSAAHGEGKSTLALALARAYALSGRKTVLIDADLRAPSIQTFTGTSSQAGLEGVLSSAPFDHRIAQHDPLSPATLIAGAHSLEIPPDQILLSDQFARLAESCLMTFDLTIIDSPALNLAPDAALVARFADVVLLVVRHAKTNQSEARRALARLAETSGKDRLIVAALNRF